MKIFKKEIEALTANGQFVQLTAFGALTCEKMLAQYELFQYAHAWGDVDFLKSILKDIYTSLLSPSTEMNVEQWRTYLDTISPDLDEFEGGLPSYALDTCITFDELLNYLETKEMIHILSLSESSFNAVDMYVQEKLDLDPSGPLLEERISTDPSMLAEEYRQQQTLNALSEITAFTQEDLVLLQSLNNQFEYLNELYIIHEI